MMRTALIATTVAVAASLLGQAALAAGEPARLAARPTLSVTYAPESPAAAFERMLAPRTPASAPQAGVTVDPLDAHFHAALWSEEAHAARIAAAAGARLR